MNRRLALLLVIVALLGSAALAAPAQAITFDPEPVYGITCTGITQSNPTAVAEWDRDTSGTGQETLRYLVEDGIGTVLFAQDDTRDVGDTAYLVSFSYTTPPAYNPIHLLITSPAGNEAPHQVLVDMYGNCEGLPFGEPAEPVEPEPEPVLVPGCDVLIPIPATAVGGSFVADAPVYWEPGQLTQPLVTIPAGKTALVIGQDSSSQYYQVLWVCDFVWVPKSTMGPNFDAVWNGAPLPTAVVD